MDSKHLAAAIGSVWIPALLFFILFSHTLVKPTSMPIHGEYRFYIIFINSHWCILHLEAATSVGHSYYRTLKFLAQTRKANKFLILLICAEAEAVEEHC